MAPKNKVQKNGSIAVAARRKRIIERYGTFLVGRISPSFGEQAIISCYRICWHGEAALNQSSQQLAATRRAFERQEQQFAKAFALIREAIEQRAFPGAALAVTHRSSLVASAGFGRFTYEEAAPHVHASTIFDLASLTKVLAT